MIYTLLQNKRWRWYPPPPPPSRPIIFEGLNLPPQTIILINSLSNDVFFLLESVSSFENYWGGGGGGEGCPAPPTSLILQSCVIINKYSLRQMTILAVVALLFILPLNKKVIHSWSLVTFAK